MIIETAIVCATVVVVASLRTAVALTPKPRLTKEAINEKRKLLTERRKTWFDSYKIARKKGKNGEHDWNQVEKL